MTKPGDDDTAREQLLVVEQRLDDDRLPTARHVGCLDGDEEQTVRQRELLRLEDRRRGRDGCRRNSQRGARRESRREKRCENGCGKRGEHRSSAGRHDALILTVLLAALCSTQCAGPSGTCNEGSLLECAIAARGGPIARLERDSEAVVHVGLPGRWQWRVEFESPLTLHLALETAGEEQHWVSDGESAATVLGNTVIARERLADSELLPVVQFLAVIGLDALRDPERFHTLEPGSGDRAAPRVLAVTTRDEPAAYYRLEFDERLRLVAAEGPLSIPLIGGGRVRARFSDFRTVDARVLPFAIDYFAMDYFAMDYEVEGNLVIEERIVHLRARSEPAAPTR